MSQHANKITNLHNFPQQITPFIGRQQEVTELTHLLGQPACRLLTLVGPGGMGKTRLAIVVATGGHFSGDIYFVPLQTVQEIKALLPAIADALNIPLTGQISPADQIYQFLHSKDVVLVLDNFEHLIEGAEKILALLANAPNLKLLVTSREVLNLQEEWLFSVHGLSLPASVRADDDLMQYDAIALFAERARRARHNFSLAEEYSGVADICRLVGGMPLALELAAAWTKTMTCQAIAAEIQQNIDFLSTRWRNVPERHRSIQAIFEQSWNMLTSQEQAVYARLSIFRGGFRREAAEHVVDASLNMLTAFVDKSLLHWNPNGRYQMHELLRQYAADQLAHMPNLLTNSSYAHCNYYLQFVSERAEPLFGGHQLETCVEIDADLDNIRAAWQWAIEYKNFDILRPAMIPLSLYYQFKSRYVDGLQAVKAIANNLHDDNPTTQNLQAYTLVALAWFRIRLGQIELAQTAAQQALTLLEPLGFPEIPNGHTHDPALPLSLVASIQGDYVQAEHLAQQALERSHKLGHYHHNQHTANYILATIAFATGRYDTAQHYAEEAYAVAKKAQNRWFMAYCQHELGNIALISGNYTAAKTYYEAGYILREAFNDWEGMALAHNHLGKVALVQNDYQEARRQYQRSLEIYQKINDKGGLAAAFDGLDQAAIGLKDFQTARHFLSQGLSIAAEMGFVPLTLSLLASVGELLCQCNCPQQAAPFLAAAATHPAGLPDTQTRARHWLETSSISFDDSSLESDLQKIVETAHFELSRLAETLIAEEPSASSEVEPPSDMQQANQALVEPLTPRELEILRLLAEGLTNQAIADQLIITLGTVKAHTNNIYGKLEVGNRTQAVARARQLNLL